MRAFGDGIWLHDGAPVVGAAGFRFPTRMVSMRLAGGGLMLWSPVALSEGLAAAVDALGPVRHIVAPNALHHLSLADWQARHPDAAIHAAPGLVAKRPDIAFASELGDAPDPAWADILDQVVIPGNRIVTEVAMFHRPSATALLADLIQQMPPGWYRGWRALVARLDAMTGPRPAMPRKFRLAFTDRAAARPAVRRILDWPARNLVAAHAPPVEGDADALLARSFAFLDP